MARRQRIDRIRVRVPVERALDLAADPTRFPEFNPLVEVPAESGRVEILGNVYYQIFRFGPARLSTRWETTSVDPVDLADRPRPAPPWTTVERGELPLFGRWISTTRYEATPTGSLLTHHLDYGVPDGPLGGAIDGVLMRPLLSVGFGVLLRRLRRWVESA